MESNVQTIIAGIKAVASGILEKDIAIVKGFSDRQTQKMAMYTADLQIAFKKGSFNDEQKKDALVELKFMVQNFVNTLKGIVTVIIEKIYNAVVRFLFDVVGAVI